MCKFSSSLCGPWCGCGGRCLFCTGGSTGLQSVFSFMSNMRRRSSMTFFFCYVGCVRCLYTHAGSRLYGHCGHSSHWPAEFACPFVTSELLLLLPSAETHTHAQMHSTHTHSDTQAYIPVLLRPQQTLILCVFSQEYYES